ncbi:ADP-dependent glucokinase [Neocloeon triangulifer]|uniref:ADP-dependent glucokinase n=1 Tax=Neocloeon triangulifer TaxID=2078957 RepID=UPI00286F349B|nr:ADP-dependent glucokinase [Neocloeon triangulifer]
MPSTALKAAGVASAIALVIALMLRSTPLVLDQRLAAVLEGLERVERRHGVGAGTRVAVGYGACNDLFADAAALFADSSAKPTYSPRLLERQQVVDTFAYFFRHGAAAERYIENASLFDELVESAARLAGSHFALGGNAPVMASRFVLEGCNVMLAAKMSHQLQEHLPPDLKVVGGDVTQDDIHLILEYKAGQAWGKFTAPRANRFIIHNDENNPLVKSLEPFGEKLTSFSPHLLVVSGLQMMDNYPYAPGQREERLQSIREQILSVGPETKVHFEMASFAELELLKKLIEYIVPYADSLGMNEQELPNLISMMQFGNVSVVSDSNPRVASALDQMRQLFRMLRDAAESVNARGVSRLHVHTLAYQAILTSKDSTVKWSNSGGAAAKASLTAHRHVCASTDVDPSRARLLLDDSFAASRLQNSRRVGVDSSEPVACWEEKLPEEVTICVAPVLVCTRAYQTAGAGDNISAAGLVLQI